MQELLGSSRARLWLAIAGTATLVLGAAYTMVQQSTRLSADDIPLSTAQTIKLELANGANPIDVVPALKTDLRGDIIPFIIITDSSQHILASSATLNGKLTLPPAGVFSFTKAHGTDHFTWQPADGVRLATRVLSYGQDSSYGFIITGQSLQQPENRVGTYDVLALLAWIAVLAWTFFVIFMLPQKSTKK